MPQFQITKDSCSCIFGQFQTQGAYIFQPTKECQQPLAVVTFSVFPTCSVNRALCGNFRKGSQMHWGL